jgi:O-antigen/teichoic acid export membrane protein
MSVRAAALWSMGAQYVAFAVSFITSVLISRFFLGPEEVGLFSIALAAAMLVSILQDFGITRYLAGETELDDRKIRACFSVSLIVALIVGLVILAMAWPVARFYGDMRLFPLLAVIAGSYCLVPFGIVPTALLQRAMNFRALFVVNVGAALATAVVGLGMAAAGWSAMSLAFATVASQGVRAALGQWLCGHRMTLKPTLAGIGPILSFGGGMSALYVSGAIGTRTPDLVVGRLISVAATGLYSRASSLAAQLVTLLTGAVGAVFYPAFARKRDRGEDLAPPYLRVVAGYSATVWPAMIFLAAASLPIVLMLYGEKWADVAPLLAWIAISEIAFTALPLHMEIPIILGRMRLLLMLNILDTAASIGTLMLGALWGLEWAAISRVAYGLIWLGIYAGLMHRLIGFRWTSIMLIWVKSLALSVAATAPLLLAYTYLAGPATIDPLTLAATIIAGTLCWLGALFLLRHPARHELIGLLVTARNALRPVPAG